MLIFRRSNCIVTASGIVTVRKQLLRAPVDTLFALTVLLPATGTVSGSQYLVFKNYDVLLERSSLLQNITIFCPNEKKKSGLSSLSTGALNG
jgi:hypothetical protein